MREIGNSILDPDGVSHADVAAPTAAAPRRIDELTAREREVLSLLAQGLTDRASVRTCG
jgi:DNA-binding NarL/FixJ family response regulator